MNIDLADLDEKLKELNYKAETLGLIDRQLFEISNELSRASGSEETLKRQIEDMYNFIYENRQVEEEYFKSMTNYEY